MSFLVEFKILKCKRFNGYNTMDLFILFFGGMVLKKLLKSIRK